MSDKQFTKEMLVEGAHAFKAGRMDRRSFLTLCAMAGVATSTIGVGSAEAAADQIVLWNWGGDAERCHGEAIGNRLQMPQAFPYASIPLVIARKNSCDGRRW